MAIVQDWKIRGTQARCEQTGETFADGDRFYTCIFEDRETDGFLRKDFSAEAWKAVRKKLDPAPFSFWKSTYKAPVQDKAPDPRGEASVEAMLRRFIDEDDPVTENARYILALMLERNKTLIPTDSKETETRTLLFYEHADTGDVFIVGDPGLRLDEIESVQREVADLLAAEEKRLSPEAGSDTEAVGEVQEEVADPGEGQPQQEGEETAEAEEEPVALAGDEAPQLLGKEAAVDAGGKLPDDVDEQFERAEGGEEPTSHDDDDDELVAEGRLD